MTKRICRYLAPPTKQPIEEQQSNTKQPVKVQHSMPIFKICQTLPVYERVEFFLQWSTTSATKTKMFVRSEPAVNKHHSVNRELLKLSADKPSTREIPRTTSEGCPRTANIFELFRRSFEHYHSCETRSQQSEKQLHACRCHVIKEDCTTR